jgi:ribosomal protein S18 acetylase RimI-like enzyme
MQKPVPHWRPLAATEIDHVEAIAAVVHPGFFEERAVFAERQRLYPAGTLLLEIDGNACGYILSHPWRRGTVPALNALLGAIPENADTYYIHDLALLPAARGSGAAPQVVAHLTRHAREAGLAGMSLVAVNGSQGFWEKQGFAVVKIPGLAEKLMSYEPGAKMMVKPLSSLT